MEFGDLGMKILKPLTRAERPSCGWLVIEFEGSKASNPGERVIGVLPGLPGLAGIVSKSLEVDDDVGAACVRPCFEADQILVAENSTQF